MSDTSVAAGAPLDLSPPAAPDLSSPAPASGLQNGALPSNPGLDALQPVAPQPMNYGGPQPAPSPSSNSVIPRYQSNQPATDPLAQASDLLQQRMGRALRIQANPFAALFAPDQVAAARQFTLQAPLTLNAINQQRQHQIDMQNRARSMGMSNPSPYVTDDGIDNFLLDQYRTGNPMQSFNAQKNLIARGKQNLVQDFAAEAFDNANKGLAQMQDAVTTLNAGGNNENAYAANRAKVIADAQANGGSVGGFDASKIPEKLSDWQAQSPGFVAQIAQMKQVYNQRAQQFENFGNFSQPLDDKADTQFMGNFTLGKSNERLPGVHAFSRGDGAIGAVLPSGSANLTKGYGNTWGLYGPDQQKTVGAQMKEPLVQFAFQDAEMAGKLARLVQDPNFGKNFADLALFNDTMGAYGRAVPGSHAAGSVGLSRLSDQQKSAFEDFVHRWNNNKAAIESALKMGKPLDRQAQSILRDMRAFSAWASSDARSELTKNAGAVIRQWGLYGAKRSQIPVDDDTFNNVVAPLYNAARNEAVQKFSQHPYIIRPGDNARILLPVGANIMGAKPPQNLPDSALFVTTALAPSATTPAAGVQSSKPAAPSAAPPATGNSPSGGGNSPAPGPTPPAPTGPAPQGFWSRLSSELMQGIPEPDRPQAASTAVSDIGAGVRNAGPIAASFGGPIAGATVGAVTGAGGKLLEDLGSGQTPTVGATLAAGGEGAAVGAMPAGTGAGMVATRAGLGAAAGGVAAAGEGGNAVDDAIGAVEGAGGALLGEGFGRALGMAGHKVWSLFSPAAKKAVENAANVIATQEPKVADATGKMTDNPAYVSAEQTLKDAGLDPEQAAYAAKVTATSPTPPKAEALANRPVGLEKQNIGAGYQQVRSDIAGAQPNVTAVKPQGPLPDGPKSLVANKQIPAVLADRADRAEMQITAPAGSLEEKWDHMFEERSKLLEDERGALEGGKTDLARGYRKIADSVRAYQEKLIGYAMGPKDGAALIDRLNALDTRYAKLMNATKGKDIVTAVSQKGDAGRTAQRYFDNLVGDDKVAKNALKTLLKLRKDGVGESEIITFGVGGDFAHNIGNAVHMGGPATAAFSVARIAYKLRQYITARGAGMPVKFRDMLMRDTTGMGAALGAAAGAQAAATVSGLQAQP
jgi:hypothetical protein